MKKELCYFEKEEKKMHFFFVCDTFFNYSTSVYSALHIPLMEYHSSTYVLVFSNNSKNESIARVMMKKNIEQPENVFVRVCV